MIHGSYQAWGDGSGPVQVHNGMDCLREVKNSQKVHAGLVSFSFSPCASTLNNASDKVLLLGGGGKRGLFLVFSN